MSDDDTHDAECWEREVQELQKICAWCGPNIPSFHPVLDGEQTVYCCSTDHQHKLRHALTQRGSEGRPLAP